jgi:hypothetical protein
MALPLVVFGIPRSGTTWVAESLAASGERHYVHEPDNEGLSYAGWRAKAGLHRYPWFGPSAEHGPYRQLFERAIAGRLPDTRGRANELLLRLHGQSTARIVAGLDRHRGWHRPGSTARPPGPLERALAPAPPDRAVLVKTVHATLALPWLAERLDFRPVVVVRHPASVVSSYLHLGMGDADRHLDAVPALREGPLRDALPALDALDDPLARMGAQVAIAYRLLAESTERLGIPVYRHETLCEDPVERLAALYAALDLPWSAGTADAIAARNRAGSGFATRRVAAEQIDVWKKRLTPAQAAAIGRGYAVLPNPFYPPF